MKKFELTGEFVANIFGKKLYTREGKVQREYLAFADLIEIYFSGDKEDE